ncbi:MAG: hypothetical protein ACOY0R_10365, partial [Chloroflexota bacterium]
MNVTLFPGHGSLLNLEWFRGIITKDEGRKRKEERLWRKMGLWSVNVRDTGSASRIFQRLCSLLESWLPVGLIAILRRLTLSVTGYFFPKTFEACAGQFGQFF